MLNVGVNGVLGRMGRMVVDVIGAADDVRLACALEEPGHAAIGTPATDGGVLISDKLPPNVDVLVDFSRPAATLERLRECVAQSTAMAIGTTGFTTDELRVIHEAACQIPVLTAPNMSVGVNVLVKIVAQVARALGQRYDIEIVETHHRKKADAPSGTALALAKSIVEATGRNMDNDLVYGRHGRPGEKPRVEIGVHAVRVGGVFGDHVVIFGDDNERVEITHRALSRRCFAEGALRAARFLAKAPIGMYSMGDVLDHE